MTVPVAPPVLGRFEATLDRLCAEQGLVAQDRFAMELVLDELVSNVIRHGGLSERDEIEVTFTLDEVRWGLVVSDGAEAFDPLCLEPPTELDAPLEERRPGGLGVHLVRQWVDSIDYRREAGRNVVTVHRARAQVEEGEPAT